MKETARRGDSKSDSDEVGVEVMQWKRAKGVAGGSYAYVRYVQEINVCVKGGKRHI